jgi:hypothetical protein
LTRNYNEYKINIGKFTLKEYGMKKDTVLENIKKAQDHIAGKIKDPENITNLERMKTMDLDSYTKIMEAELDETFTFWKDCIKENKTLGIVHFEWSYNDTYAYSYGFTKVVSSKEINSRPGFSEFEYSGSCFEECPGFGKALSQFLEATDFENGSTDYLDYQITKIAEIFFLAMEKITCGEAFKNLPKEKEVVFELTRHERFEIIAYIWEA